jgi:hypothetical protein
MRTFRSVECSISCNRFFSLMIAHIEPKHVEEFFSIVKPTRCTISPIYIILEQHSTCFGGLSVHHQESRAVHTAAGICHTGSVVACYLERSFVLASSHRTWRSTGWRPKELGISEQFEICSIPVFFEITLLQVCTEYLTNTCNLLNVFFSGNKQNPSFSS